MRKLREILRLKCEQRMGHRAVARACGAGAWMVVGQAETYRRWTKDRGIVIHEKISSRMD
jgi:hypothetical protein